MAENPFRVGGHVTGSHFTDRADEVRTVRRALAEPSRLLVYGPRRMGKSSTIARAVERFRAEGGLVAWADFSTATELTDVSNRLLRSFAGELKGVQERLVEFARSVRPEASLTFDQATQMPALSFGVALRRRPVDAQREAFESVADRIEAFAAEHDGRVALIFDEFQDILEIAGDRADWFLRGIMQRHQHVTYVCAGSKESLIHEMLDRKRAFYKHFELLHLDPIDPGHFARWIEDRMASAGVSADGLGRVVIEAAGDRTQDCIQVAREVFSAALPKGRAEEADVDRAVDAIMRSEAAVFQAIWNDLSGSQQNALRAIAAAPEHPFGAESVRRFGLGSSSTMARAIEALRKRGFVARTAEAVEFDNPFLRRWVERTVLQDVPSE